jgi:hypothetical protein
VVKREVRPAGNGTAFLALIVAEGGGDDASPELGAPSCFPWGTENPMTDKPVVVRAFRGSRRTSVYREHVLAAAAFGRIVETGAAHRLPVISSLGAGGLTELEKEDARALAEELSSLRVSGELLDLDDDVVAVAELGRWCARASGAGWMSVAGG